ncbi:MAG: 50S ribosomal protein L11 methyltransferase [Bacteroidia bacterium]|nr:50S ribosomal protein L11 methyltransferase [Bacteroidia bacterium]
MSTEQPDYIRLRFPVSEHDEQVQALLHSLEPLGFLEEESTWEAYFPCEAWDGGISDAFSASLHRLRLDIVYDVERFEKQNWNKEWEDSITPVRVSDRIVITPSWHTVDTREDEILLVIDPKMSFGTGFHATTRLMLRLMEQTVQAGDTVLDVGTGTGVLAIAAVKLGAQAAEGMDIDEWSKENAEENCIRNGVLSQVRIHHGSLETVHGPYDLILSNITRNDNIEMLPALAAMLRKGGRIVLSGFYSTDRGDLLSALHDNGFTLIAEMAEDEWHAISGEKAS